MNNHRGFQFGLLLLILAAFSGLIGFVIIYHYATYERPVQHFAIVIDAGSTQTRSNLFSIRLDAEALVQYSEPSIGNQSSATTSEPLNKLFQVQQVDSCVNGGPLAAIQSFAEAGELVKKCLEKFTRRIKQLGTNKSQDGGDNDDKEDEEPVGWTSEDMADELAEKNRRVNSVTHLYLGATAGMRALNELNHTLAREKLNWIDKAINESNTIVTTKGGGLYINKGYVGILEGSDEAAYGWTSVNFVCDQLKAIKPGDNKQVRVEHGSSLKQKIYAYQTTPQELLPLEHEVVATDRSSVGTLELGGASSQMAHEVLAIESLANLGQDYQVQELDLFNAKYKLATRSDLCYGMSQAALRANFVLLRDYYNATRKLNSPSSVRELIEPANENSLSLELVNPCLQKASKVQLATNGSSTSIRGFLRGPCLVDAIQDDFKLYLLRKSEIFFVGTGNVDQCNQLLDKIIDPQICRKYFQLCPKERNKQSPPANMSFVTISGYNKALQILKLRRAPVRLGSSRLTTSSGREIAAKLGGYSVEHEDFTQSTREFCLQDAGQFYKLYPTMNKKFYPINCLQLVFINKLLTEFYLFEPQTSWHQIKFLIFPPALPITNGKLVEQQTEQQQKQQQEIGWTLGMLLNATSRRYNANDNGPDQTIFHHHSSSVLFVMRATILLMLACILLAIAVIVLGMLAVRHHHRKAYISHPLEDEPTP